MGSFTAQPAEECLVTLGCRRAAQSRAFYFFVTACRASKFGADILDQDGMIIVI